MRVREAIPPLPPGSYGPAIKTASYKSPMPASKIKCPGHSMARANLNKSKKVLTSTNTASKCIPMRPRIYINWNPPSQTVNNWFFFWWLLGQFLGSLEIKGDKFGLLGSLDTSNQAKNNHLTPVWSLIQTYYYVSTLGLCHL